MWQQIQTVNHTCDLDLSFWGQDRRRKAVDGWSTSYVQRSIVPEVPKSEEATLKCAWITFLLTGGLKKERKKKKRP